MRPTLLFLLACALPAGSLAAAPTEITIDALVAQALAENPELRFYEAEIVAAEGDQRSAGAWRNPVFSGELGAKRTVGDGLDAAGVVWAAAVQQTFEWPGRASLRKAIAQRQVKLAEQGLAQFRASLEAAVREKAFALLAAQRRQRAAAEVAARGEELVGTLFQREPSGIAPQLEARAIEAAVLKLKRAASEASREAEATRLDLNQLRGRMLAEPVTIREEPLVFGELPPVSELIKRAATGNFALQLRETELEQQGFRLKLAKNAVWPDVTAGPVIEQEFAGDQETRATLSASIPLPLWDQNRGGIEAARARETQAQSSLIVAQRDVERRIRQAAVAYETHRKEMARWNPKIAEELRSAAELADRHYRLGAVPLATYLEVQSSYLDALDAIYATRAEALQARAELEALTGGKIR